MLAVGLAGACSQSGGSGATVRQPSGDPTHADAPVVTTSAVPSLEITVPGPATATTPPRPSSTPTGPVVPQLPAYFRNWMPDDKAILDADGVVMEYYDNAGLGREYSPTAVAEAALGYYDRWLVDTDSAKAATDRAAFMTQVKWLLANQTADGRWLFKFAWGRQKVPWWSAMTEGLAMSVLLRAYGLAGDPACLTAISRAVTTFGRSVGKSNGVVAPVVVKPKRGKSKTYVVYQEYQPGYVQNVLNGWMFSLVGLYETATYLHDGAALEALTKPDRGYAAVKALLPYYDTGNWSRYNITDPAKEQLTRFSTLNYHNLVIGQLRYMTKISGDGTFAKWADHFQNYWTACKAKGKCPPPSG
jgi:heparosan-N-sulfate-glucuronate 5-epimerase